MAVCFEAAALIITPILAGRWLQARAKRRTTKAIRGLLARQPRMARLTAVADAVRLSRATTRNIRQTLVCANACIVALLPVAAGALSGFGIALSPVPAAVVMAPYGVFVLSNALPLRRFRPLHRAIR